MFRRSSARWISMSPATRRRSPNLLHTIRSTPCAHVGLAPQDLPGGVPATSRRTYRCRRASTVDKLDWLVALDYKDLSIAKPLDGQMVTEAEGTIVIDRTKAVIAAKAKLSGVPAEIDAVEPFGKTTDRRAQAHGRAGARRQGARRAGAWPRDLVSGPDQGHARYQGRRQTDGRGRSDRRPVEHSLGRMDQGGGHSGQRQLRA